MELAKFCQSKGPMCFGVWQHQKISLILYSSKSLSGWPSAFYTYALTARSFHPFEVCVKILENSSIYIMFMSLDIGDKKALFKLLIHKMLQITVWSLAGLSIIDKNPGLGPASKLLFSSCAIFRVCSAYCALLHTVNTALVIQICYSCPE